MKIETKREGQWINIYKDGIKVKGFNVLAEDYAHTLAEKYANKLRKELAEKRIGELNDG